MISLMNIVHDTTVDGPGFRTSIYCAGCVNACKGCHNPSTWDIKAGTPTSTEDILKEIMADEFADVTFTGGDPMYQAEGFAELAEAIKAQSNKSIWCYTGYTFEHLIAKPDAVRLMRSIDVLVDGRFEELLHDPDLLFRGSSNQRIIDVPKSLAEQKAVLLDYNPMSLF